jgi:arsenate reductase
MTMKLHGIPNCDTVKKARVALTEAGRDFEFQDFKKQGVQAADVQRWCQALGWEKVVNRQGTTWRKLDDALKASVVDQASAVALAVSQPSVIKRPVIERDGQVTVGWTPEVQGLWL